MKTAYQQLEAECRTIKSLNDVQGLLQWDRDTMMPAGAAAGRTVQLETLAVMAHARQTSPALGELIAKAEDDSSLDDWQRRNLELAKRNYTLATLLPEDLVARQTRVTNQSHNAWLAAREANDWQLWLPHFEEVVAVTREIAALKARASGPVALRRLP